MKENPNEWLLEFETKMHPNELIFHIERHDYLAHLKLDFQSKINNLKLYFINCLNNSKKSAQHLLIRIIHLSDKIYLYKNKYRKIWAKHSKSQTINNFYLFVLGYLEDILNNCHKYAKNIYDSLNVTRYCLQDKKMEIRIKLTALKKRLIEKKIDKDLIEVLIIDLEIKLNNKSLSKSTLDYLKNLLENLLNLQSVSVIAVENRLYQYNFNSPNLFHRFSSNCQHELETLPGIHDKINFLIQLENRFISLPFFNRSKQFMDDFPIRKQIINFINEKKNNYIEQLNLRRMESQDQHESEILTKIKIKSSVSALAFFFGLLINFEILFSDNKRKAFELIARYFRTEKTSVISVESLLKKSTDVDFKTARIVRNMLYKIILYIDEKFNTKDFN